MQKFLLSRWLELRVWHTLVAVSWRVFAAIALATAAPAHAGKPAAIAYSYSSVGTPGSLDAPEGRNKLLPVPAWPSYVLMGGGPDVDAGFRWMIDRAGVRPGTGGRLVVIRAAGDGAYNPYVYFSGRKSSTAAVADDGWVGGAALGLSSVETLVIPTRAAANQSFVADIVRRADAIWIAGGDQTVYLREWYDTALHAALNAAIGQRVPIGGTSAGLAVLGGFDFSGENGTVSSLQVLANPYNVAVTFNPSPLSAGNARFLSPPELANTILDSHLDSRDRMGRLVGFVSRLIAPTPGPGSSTFGCAGGVLTNALARGIGVGVETALLVGGDANGTVTGRRVTNVSSTTESAVYFVSITQGPTSCVAGRPLDAHSIELRKIADDTTVIDFGNWSALPLFRALGVNQGVLSPADPY